jgi:HlyD family secretion protein
LSRLVGLLVLGIMLGALATWAYQANNQGPAQASADSSRPAGEKNATTGSVAKRSIFALGTLEPRDGQILITSPLAGTHIRKLLVREGQRVAAGEPLIELDDTAAAEELRIAEAQRQQAAERQQNEIDLSQQRLAAADLAVQQAQEARGVELQFQQKQLDVAERKLKQAQDELKRLEGPQRVGTPLVSTQQLEHQHTLIDIATAERDAASAALAKASQALDFNAQKAQSEQRAARQAVEIAKRTSALATLDRQTALARHKLDQTKINAPSAGTIISSVAHPGEIVTSQPLMQMADLTALVCHAEIDVADIPLLKGKRGAFVTSRAFRSSKVKATIERIRNVAGAATLRPADPRKSVDRTVATVVLAVDAGEAAQLLGSETQDAGSALLGLQVDVEIPL